MRSRRFSCGTSGDDRGSCSRNSWGSFGDHPLREDPHGLGTPWRNPEAIWNRGEAASPSGAESPGHPRDAGSRGPPVLHCPPEIGGRNGAKRRLRVSRERRRTCPVHPRASKAPRRSLSEIIRIDQRAGVFPWSRREERARRPQQIGLPSHRGVRSRVEKRSNPEAERGLNHSSPWGGRPSKFRSARHSPTTQSRRGPVRGGNP